jgi:hypothetical protein
MFQPMNDSHSTFHKVVLTVEILLTLAQTCDRGRSMLLLRLTVLCSKA